MSTHSYQEPHQKEKTDLLRFRQVPWKWNAIYPPKVSVDEGMGNLLGVPHN